MPPMLFIERYFWVACMVVMTAVVLHVRKRLGLRDWSGAVTALIITNLPLVIQGAGALTDPTFTIHSVMNVRHGWVGPAYVASVVLVWGAGFYWLFVRHGAEQLAAADIRLLNLPRSADGIKLFYVVLLCGGVLGLIFASIMNV